MTTSPASPGGRRSWRQTPRSPDAAPTGLGRWFWSIAAISLLLLFLAWLWWSWSFTYQTHLLALHPGDHDRLIMSPVAYAQEDCRALAKLDPDTFRALRIESPAVLDELPRVWLPYLRRDRDVALVYVNTHGFAKDGKAMLFCERPIQGQTAPLGCPVSDLLKRLADSPALRKLLILDCGRLAADPRFGIVANEFPRLVESELKNLPSQGQNLYVLLACSALETTVVSHSKERSLFGLALEEGLKGAANDADDDANVSLRELAEYLQKQLRFSDGATWTPVLLSQNGPVNLDDQVTRKSLDEWFVCRPKQFASNNPATQSETPADPSDKTPESKPEKATAAQPGGARTGSAPNPTPVALRDEPAAPAPANNPPSGGVPPPDGGKKEPPPQPSQESGKSGAADAPSLATDSATANPPPTTNPPPVANPQSTPSVDAARPPELGERKRPHSFAAIEKLWKLRDHLQARSAGGWSPIDFAPHAWREVNAYLLDAEARCRAGEVYDTPELLTELNDLQGLLTELSDAMAADREARNPGLTSVATRLQTAWNRYRVSPAAESFRQSPPSRQALRAYWDVLFLAPELPGWCVATSEDKLPAQILDELARVRIPADEPDSGTLSTLVQRVAALTDLRRQLIDPQKTGDVLGLTGAASEPGPATLRKLESALSVSFLPAETRSRVLQALLDAPQPEFAGSVNAAARSGDVSAKQWPQLQSYCKLQIATLGLLGPTTLPNGSAAMASPFRWEGATAEGRRFESALASVVPEAKKSATSDDSRRLGILVDARDALAFDNALAQSDRLFLTPPLARRKQERLEVAGIQELVRVKDQAKFQAVSLLELDTASWRTCEIRFRAELKDASSVTCRFEPDKGVSVRRKDDESPFGTGWFPLRLHAIPGGASEASLTIEVKANHELEVGEASPAKLRIFLQSGSVVPDKPYELSCELPTSHAIDVVARRVGADTIAPEPIEWRLRPFANRRTDFQLALRRRAGKAQKVQVELYAAARHPRADWKPGRLFDGTRLMPYVLAANPPQVERVALARSAELILPPGEEPAPLTWLPPTPVVAAAANPPTTPATPVAVPAENAHDITHGLMCVIRVLDPPGSPPLTRWLEIDPLLPGDFFDGEIRVNSVPQALQLALRLQDVNSDGQIRRVADVPGDLAALPLSIHWETRRGTGLAANVHAPIDSPLKIDEQSQELRDLRWPFSASLGKQTPEPGWQSFVTINDSPRALAYEFGNAGWQRLQSPRRVLVTGVAVADTAYRLNAPGDEGSDDQGKGPPQAKTLPSNSEEHPLVFAKPKQPGPTVRLHFEVDAPVDAFYGNQPEVTADAVELLINDDDQTKKTFYFDRDVRTTLHQITPWLSIGARIQDFDIEEPISTFNSQLKATVQLRWKGSIVASDSCWLLVDDQPPEIAVKAPREVEQTQTLAVEVRGTDASGIADVRLELAFDKNRSGEWEESTEPPVPYKRKPSTAPLGLSPTRFEVPTDELPPGTYFVRSQVRDTVGLVSEWDERRVIIRPAPLPVKKKKPVVTLPPVPQTPPPAAQPKPDK